MLEYELKDIFSNEDRFFEIIKKIEKSEKIARALLVIAKFFDMNKESFSNEDIAKILLWDTGYSRRILEFFVSANLIGLHVGRDKKNYYHPITNNQRPIIFDFVDEAMKKLKINKKEVVVVDKKSKQRQKLIKKKVVV